MEDREGVSDKKDENNSLYMYRYRGVGKEEEEEEEEEGRGGDIGNARILRRGRERGGRDGERSY